MQAKPRIKFGTQYIDFDKVNYYDPMAFTNRVRGASASGKRSVASFYDREKVEALLDFEDAQKIINEIRQLHEYAKDGSTFEFWMDRKVTAYWPLDGDLYSNNRGKFTFTRASSAYFENPDTGLLEAVTTNQPRFRTGKFGRSLSIQKSRENRITHPSGLDDASWTKGGGVSAIGANTEETKDPNGGTIADKIVLSSAPTDIEFDTSQAIGTDDASYGLWLKSQTGTGSDVIIGMERVDTGAVLASTQVSVIPTWQRFQIAYESAGSIASDFRALIQPQSTDILYHYSSQLESGADVLYSTDDIDPSATSLATRAIELNVFAADGIINPLQGTLMFWMRPLWDYNKHANSWLFYCQGVVAARLISLQVEETGLFRVQMRDGDGSTRVNASQTAFNILTKETWHRIALTWDPTISNGINLYVDGNLILTSSNDPFTPNILGTNFAIGSENTGVDNADADFDDIVIYNEVLTADKIATDFNRSTALALERTYWPALELMVPEFNPEIIRGTRMYSYLLQALEVI